MSAPAALRSDRSVGDSLRAVASSILSEAHGILTDANKDNAVAIHDFRKCMKRWRGLLRLLEPHLGDSAVQLRRDAGDLARSLTSARDLTTAIDALEDLVGARLLPSEGLSERSLGTVRARLEKMKANSERKAWDETSRQRILDYITAASYQVTLWDFSALTFVDVAKGLEQTYRRARNAIPDDWTTASAEDLHDLRRRVVVHRYQMELVEPAWPRLGRIWVEEAQRLRNRLGKYQDLAVLMGLTTPHQALAPWRSRLTPAIAEQQAHYTKSASRVAARLFAEPPKAFRRRIEALWTAQDDDGDVPADRDPVAT